MPDSKTPEPQQSSKEPAKEPASRGSADERQEELLRQIASLTKSVEKLARAGQEPPPPPTPPPPPPAPPDPEAEERRRVEFAYLFVGEVLGRRGAVRFQAPRVQVARDTNRLTFTGLGTGTAARLRAANGQVDVLENLQNGVAAQTALPNDQPIDSIVVSEGRDGVAVALGPCLAPDVIIIE